MGVMGKHERSWVPLGFQERGVQRGDLRTPLQCRDPPSHNSAAYCACRGEAPARPTLPARGGEDKTPGLGWAREKPPTLPKAGLGADIAGRAERRPGLRFGRDRRRDVRGIQSQPWLPVPVPAARAPLPNRKPSSLPLNALHSGA